MNYIKMYFRLMFSSALWLNGVWLVIVMLAVNTTFKKPDPWGAVPGMVLAILGLASMFVILGMIQGSLYAKAEEKRKKEACDGITQG